MQRIRPRTFASVFFLLFTALIGVGVSPVLADGGGGGDPPPPPPAAPDFALSVNYGSPSFVGNLVRGAVFGIPCGQCNGGALPQPAYIVPDPLGCFYDWNQISVTGLNGFTGTVSLSLLNLPAGVTSSTAPSIALPQGGSSAAPLKLLASTTAAPGTSSVTLQGASGTLVHTVSLTLSVADQLPPCQ